MIVLGFLFMLLHVVHLKLSYFSFIVNTVITQMSRKQIYGRNICHPHVAPKRLKLIKRHVFGQTLPKALFIVKFIACVPIGPKEK